MTNKNKFAIAGTTKLCPCGKKFTCGAETGKCWCADLPKVLPVPAAEAGCYCPDCLRRMLNEKGAKGVGTTL